MKTTIDIADALLARAKRIAARDRTTIKALVEESLRRVLKERECARRFDFRPVTFGGQGLQPGMEDWDAVRDAIYEGRGT